MKPESLLRGPDKYDFTIADALLSLQLRITSVFADTHLCGITKPQTGFSKIPTGTFEKDEL